MDSAYQSLVEAMVRSTNGRGNHLKQYLALLRCFVGYLDSGWANMAIKDMNKLLDVLLEVVGGNSDKGEERKIWRIAVHILDETLPAWASDAALSNRVIACMLVQAGRKDVGKKTVIYRILGTWVNGSLKRRHVASGHELGSLNNISVARLDKVELGESSRRTISVLLMDEMRRSHFPVKPKAKMLSFGNRDKLDYDAKVVALTALLSSLRRAGCQSALQAAQLVEGFDTVQQCCAGWNLNLARHAWALAVMVAPYYPKRVASTVLNILPKISHFGNAGNASEGIGARASTTKTNVADSPPEEDTLCCISALQAARLCLANENVDASFSQDMQTDLFESCLKAACETKNVRVFCEAVHTLAGKDELTRADTVSTRISVSRAWQLSGAMRSDGNVGRGLCNAMEGFLCEYIGTYVGADADADPHKGGKVAPKRRRSSIRDVFGGAGVQFDDGPAAGALYPLLRAAVELAHFLGASPAGAVTYALPSAGEAKNEIKSSTTSSTGENSLLDLESWSFGEMASTASSPRKTAPSLVATQDNLKPLNALRNTTDVLFTLLMEIDEAAQARAESGMRALDKPYLLHPRLAIIKALLWLLPSESAVPSSSGAGAGAGLFPISFAGNSGSSDHDVKEGDAAWAELTYKVTVLMQELAECGAPHCNELTYTTDACSTQSLAIRRDISSTEIAARALLRDLSDDIVRALMKRFGENQSATAPVCLARIALTVAEQAVRLSPHHETTWLLTDLWGFLAGAIATEGGGFAGGSSGGGISMNASSMNITSCSPGCSDDSPDTTTGLLLCSLLRVVNGKLVPSKTAVDFLDRYQYTALYRAYVEGSSVGAGHAEEEDDSDDELDVLEERSQMAGTVDASVTGSVAASRMSLQNIRNSGTRSVMSGQHSSHSGRSPGTSVVPRVTQGGGGPGASVLQGLESKVSDATPGSSSLKLACTFAPTEPWESSLEVLAQSALWLAVMHAARGTFGAAMGPWTALTTLLADARISTPGMRACALAASAETVHLLREQHLSPVAQSAVTGAGSRRELGSGVAASLLPGDLETTLLCAMAAAVDAGYVSALEAVSVRTALEARALDSSSTANSFSSSSSLPLPMGLMSARLSTLSMDEILGLAGRTAPSSSVAAGSLGLGLGPGPSVGVAGMGMGMGVPFEGDMFATTTAGGGDSDGAFDSLLGIF